MKEKIFRLNPETIVCIKYRVSVGKEVEEEILDRYKEAALEKPVARVDTQSYHPAARIMDERIPLKGIIDSITFYKEGVMDVFDASCSMKIFEAINEVASIEDEGIASQHIEFTL